MKALDILIYILDCGGMIHVDRGFMSNVSKAIEELKEHLSDKDDQIKWLREELKYHEEQLKAKDEEIERLKAQLNSMHDLMYRSGYSDAMCVVDKIFNDHEAQLKAKDEEIERLKELIRRYESDE